MKTWARYRTVSRQRAAGSRRNKKYKFVGTQPTDMRDQWLFHLFNLPIGTGSKPDHKSRAVSMDAMFPFRARSTS
jgi:hypothetical protein